MIPLLLLFLLTAIFNLSILSAHRSKLIWSISLFYSMLCLGVSSLMWVTQLWSLPTCGGVGAILKASFFPMFFNSWANLEITWDGLSLCFILLSSLLTPLCLMVSASAMESMVKEFCVLLFFTQLVLVLVFSVSDLMLFYILFESTLIPLFIMMGVWGGSKDKVKAAFYFFLFTLVGSVFMLLSILKIYSLTGTSSNLILSALNLPAYWQGWIAGGMILGMAVKVPMFPSHMWLPQAHVEAPVAGSVLLAGIMLKLGGYGLISFCWSSVPAGVSFLSPLFITLSIIAIVYGGLVTCSQSDMKSLVAYSSVAHMGLVTTAIFSGDQLAQVGSVFIMLAHGMVSSALFISVTQLYVSTGSSLMSFYSGVVVSMPLFSMSFIMLNLANMALPLSANFLAELMSVVGMMSELPFITPGIVTGVVLSALYSLFMVNSMCFGVPSSFTLSLSDLNSIEMYPIAILIVAAYQLGMNPDWLLSPLQSYSLL